MNEYTTEASATTVVQTEAANDMTYQAPMAQEALLPKIEQFVYEMAQRHQTEKEWQRWEQGFMSDWLKVAKQERKVLAAQKMNKKIAGKNKGQLSQANLRKACEWIFQFGWSSPSIINLLLEREGSFTSRYCTHNKPKDSKASEPQVKSNVKREVYFVCTPTAAGSYQPDFPRMSITLARKGLDLALEKYAGMEYPELKKDKIPTGKRGTDLRHSAIIQKTAIHFLRSYPQVRFTSERMYFVKNEAGVKKPDGIIDLADSWRLFLEVELSNKSGASFSKFIKDVYEALKQNRAHYVVLFTDSVSIFQKYGSALRGLSQVPMYEKSKRLTGPNANFRMPPEYAARVFVRTIDPAYPEVAVHQFLQDFYASGISKIAPKLETLDARYWEGELERLEFLEGWEP